MIKILFGNSFSKKVRIFEKFQFFAKFFDKTADCKEKLSIAKYSYSSFKPVF